MAFSTKDTTVSTGTQYLAPGLNDNVVFVSFTAGTSSQKGTPYLEVTLAKEGQLDTNSTKDKFYMSEKAEAKSLEKVVHLLQDGAGVPRADIDKAGMDASDLADYAAKLTALAKKGKPMRFKFTGEEYLKDGVDLKVAKRIGFAPFCEPMTVAAADSGLKYDTASKYDYVALPAEARPVAATPNAADAELPF